MKLIELKENWDDTPIFHQTISEHFTEMVNKDEQLNLHRTFVEKNAFGFGERAFQYLWDIIVDDMPDTFSFIEVGVFRFQIVSLIRLLADRQHKVAKRYCVTPLSPIGIGWESDYAADGERIHDEFGLSKDYIVYKGLSNDASIVLASHLTAPYDLVYLDGGHEYETALFDLETYGEFVKRGGYLVIDDCNCDLNFPPSGFFTGIDTVTKAKNDWLSKSNNEWEFYGSVVHISIYRRK